MSGTARELLASDEIERAYLGAQARVRGVMDILIQQILNALSLGGTYALLALGLAVVFSVLGLINFAPGELMTIAG